METVLASFPLALRAQLALLVLPALHVFRTFSSSWLRTDALQRGG